MKKLSEVLTGPETWCQGAMQRGDRVCLVGALELLMRGNKAFGPEVRRLRRVIEEEFGPLPPYQLGGLNPIPLWNDDPARTWADIARVIDAFDRDRVLNP